MSDLSQPPLDLLGAEHWSPTSSAWPTPNLPGYPASSAIGMGVGADAACLIEGLNGHRINAELATFDARSGVFSFRLPHSRSLQSLGLDQFRRLCLSEPLVALRQPGDAGHPATQGRTEPFRVDFRNTAGWEGQTLGHHDQPCGLFLFEPLDAGGTLRRWFVPRPAYTHAAIGQRIGDALVQQHSASPEEIRLALIEQRRLRQRKIGDLLVVRQIITADELARAIDHQSRLPKLRFGEALIALGFITETQLDGALAQQRDDRHLPLGELLVTLGLVTRGDLETALARKMGFPLVDVAQFPPEEEAVARLPQAVAVRLSALPLMLRAGRLVTAMGDPNNRASVAELERACRCKLVPVLARAGTLSQAIVGAYDKLATGMAALSAAQADRTPTPAGATRMIDIDAAALGQSQDRLLRLIEAAVIEARRQGIADIHVECPAERKSIRVRLRVKTQDGVRPRSPLAAVQTSASSA